ncbi:MAG: class I SAM-dependent methyltransferase [Myxococcota bacterium]
MRRRATCPSCGGTELRPFHRVEAVPVNSVLSLESQEEALSFPRGDIRLAFCNGCGFIHNTDFEPDRLEYSERYDPTQAFSPTFNRWHRHLAEAIAARHRLEGKTVLEIGCGKGEFLALLCEVAGCRGIGFDPAFVPARGPERGAGRAEFIQDWYSEQYAGIEADLVCCKMTLEHVPRCAELVSMVRRAIGDRRSTTVFFQVPDALRILQEGAFWDVYYEHCNYFTAGSLARLFRRCGFEVEAVQREFEAQYVTIEARPGSGDSAPPLAAEESVGELWARVARFAERQPEIQGRWRRRMQVLAAAGRGAVLWGSGSKGVSFLTTLGLGDEVEAVVDINPHRQGKHMLGTGHPIVAPEALQAIRPGVVIVMNPIYRREIEGDLHRLGISSQVWTT